MIESLDLVHFEPCIVLVGGPSGIGKTSIVNELVDSYDGLYVRPMSYTSRNRRPHETDSEYIFVRREDIYRKQADGEIVTIDDVYGSLYAMSRKSIETIVEQGKIPIKEVHPKNHAKIRDIVCDTVSVLVTPVDSASSLNNHPPLLTRHDRIDEDTSYYEALDYLSFDIVMESDMRYTPKTLADHLHLCLQSHLMTRHYFPAPSAIDRTNAVGYAKTAPEFSDDFRITTRNFHELSQQYFAESAARYLTGQMKCLEIGVGHGWLNSIVPFQDIDYSGVDISPEMLKINNDPRKVQASARHMGFQANDFDVVVASLADPYFYPAALCEIHRVLKNDGVFIFSSPSRQWSDGVRESCNKDKTVFSLAGLEKASVYSFTFTLQELGQLLSICGFSVIESQASYGSMLLKAGKDISPAITDSARKQGIALSDLPILNFVIARKVS